MLKENELQLLKRFVSDNNFNNYNGYLDIYNKDNNTCIMFNLDCKDLEFVIKSLIDEYNNRQ